MLENRMEQIADQCMSEQEVALMDKQQLPAVKHWLLWRSGRRAGSMPDVLPTLPPDLGAGTQYTGCFKEQLTLMQHRADRTKLWLRSKSLYACCDFFEQVARDMEHLVDWCSSEEPTVPQIAQQLPAHLHSCLETYPEVTDNA